MLSPDHFYVTQEELPLSLTFPWIDVVVVHAGLVPGVSMDNQDFFTLTKIRDLRKGSDLSVPNITSWL